MICTALHNLSSAHQGPAVSPSFNDLLPRLCPIPTSSLEVLPDEEEEEEDQEQARPPSLAPAPPCPSAGASGASPGPSHRTQSSPVECPRGEADALEHIPATTASSAGARACRGPGSLSPCVLSIARRQASLPAEMPVSARLLGSNVPRRLRVGVSSTKGPRQHMEDFHVIHDLPLQRAAADSCLLLGIFDGHAGADVALYLSTQLPGQLSCHLSTHQHSPLQALRLALHQVECDTLKMHTASGCTAGSTALLALVMAGALYIANVGDCRAVLSRAGGSAHQLTTDHTASEQAEALRLMAAGVTVSSDGYLHGDLGVSRAIGSWGAKHKGGLVADPQLVQHTILEGDEFLVIGSDGLYQEMSSADVVRAARRALAESDDPQAAADALRGRALKLGTHDNITVLVVRLSSTPISQLHQNSRLKLKAVQPQQQQQQQQQQPHNEAKTMTSPK